MKRVLIFSAICAAIFLTVYAEADRYYAPRVSIGQFTSSLAGSGRHVLDCAISLELVEQEGALSLMQSPKWMNRMLPDVDGENPVVNVLFDSFIVQ